jgi:glycosyltransferase involved in cell wall biosynthesis
VSSPNLSDGIGLVHDYLLTMRGAERTFAAIVDCWPNAPVYTTIYDQVEMGPRFAGHRVSTSYLQRLGIRQKGFRRLLPFFPRAVERLPVGDHDLLLSSSSAFAHGIHPRPGALHICYCHSPFRYAWHERERALSEVSSRLRPVMNILLERIKQWDLLASKRVTHYIANSKITQQRIADSYGRDSIVVNPPVDVGRFGAPQEPEDYFLFVGEVVGHKRVEIAIEAAQRAGAKIKVVGDGPERRRLTVEYGDTVQFMGRTTDEQLSALYAHAKALVVPNVEEFGIAAVEAQAAGRPVIAIDEGGTSETVEDGVTGVLVPHGTIDEFAETMAATDFLSFDSARIASHAARFSTDRFRREIMEFVASKTAG